MQKTNRTSGDLAWAVFGFFTALSVAGAPSWAAEAVTTVKWHGHAAFEIVTPKGKVLFIDPWLKNPMNPEAAGDEPGKMLRDPLAKITRADYIFVSHGHSDHVGESVELGKKTHARLVASFELAQVMASALGYPKDQMGFDTLMNPGGVTKLGDGEVTVSLTPAVHSSGVTVGAEGKEQIIYGGNPTGIVIRIENGPTIYHTGDTAYFTDMKLIAEQHHPDLALINIGGHFGMEPEQAAQAARAVGARVVVPHHYGTFPVLTADTAGFEKALRGKGAQVRALKPGESIRFVGRELDRHPRHPVR